MNTRSTDFVESSDPFALFERWHQEASKTELNDPNAMSVASVDEDGMPNVRIVLLKDFDVRGASLSTPILKAKRARNSEPPQSCALLPLEIPAPPSAGTRHD